MHRILAIAAAAIIESVFERRKVLDHALAQAFAAQPKWGKRDRGFIAETVFEVVRWRRTLSFLVESDAIESLCAAQWVRMGYELPEWWQYEGARTSRIQAREIELATQPRAIRESIPDWLDALGEMELGTAWDQEIAALNRRASVYLRVNTLKTNRADAIAWLAQNNVIASEVPDRPDALALPVGKTLPKPLRLDGRIEIQDAGSQTIAPLLNPQSGDFVIDTCAGAGGKTLHLAALMQNQGQIIAMDIAGRKLQELERRAERAGASACIQTHKISPTTIESYAGKANRVLIDAPCSGLGTLKRQPDLKWRLEPDQIDKVRNIQTELLHSYTDLLQPGGQLVYATCSILPSENRAVVDSLLKHGGFKLIQEAPVSPALSGYDGFYAAVVEKNAD